MAVEYFPISDFYAVQSILQNNCVGANELFGKVEFGTYLSCYDHENNAILTLDPSWIWTGLAAPATQGTYYQGTMPSNRMFKTKCGIMFLGTTYGDACVIAKTNNGGLGVLLPNGDSSASCLLGLHNAVAFGDETPLPQSDAFYPAASDIVSRQTVLSPVPTHPAFGGRSYLEGVYFLTQSQYRTEGEIMIAGVRYVTNGFIALKDV